MNIAVGSRLFSFYKHILGPHFDARLRLPVADSFSAPLFQREQYYFSSRFSGIIVARLVIFFSCYFCSIFFWSFFLFLLRELKTARILKRRGSLKKYFSILYFLFSSAETGNVAKTKSLNLTKGIKNVKFGSFSKPLSKPFTEIEFLGDRI